MKNINHVHESGCMPEPTWIPSERLKFIDRFRVERADSCIDCGLCASLCQYGVHERIPGHAHILPPKSYDCIGPQCSGNSFYCVRNCPTKSLDVRASQTFPALGDLRWTADMILATWKMAETGLPMSLEDPANTGACLSLIHI